MNRACLLLLFCALGWSLQAQHLRVVDAQTGERLEGATLYVRGKALAISLQNGKIDYSDSQLNDSLIIYLTGYEKATLPPLKRPKTVRLVSLMEQLAPVEIAGKKHNEIGLEHLRSVEGVYVYAGKKTEVFRPAQMAVNLATNNTRQAYSKVSGLNIWESDCAGLQLGIGGRGLSPNRSTHFNTRQNHYDISADALGYPESYYSPPLQAVHRVEIVRGAASLQYGPQLGGLVNFELKDRHQSSKFVGTADVSGGSGAFLNVFVDGGKKWNQWTAYGYVQRKQGNCFRPNSAFQLNGGHFYLARRLPGKQQISFESTHMGYLAQQPGGLTDQQFEADPYQSNRERNWFRVQWNLYALKYRAAFGNQWKLESQTFGLVASREALGYLGAINRPDPGTERDIISGAFKNIGNETRLLHHSYWKTGVSSLVVGVRAYLGTNASYQGHASAESDANFRPLDGGMKSDYFYPNRNFAGFVEKVIPLSGKLKLTPGFRVEHINTQAEGKVREKLEDLAGNVIYDRVVFDTLQSVRTVALYGIGINYTLSDEIELYANHSTNYRPVNFTDLKIANPSFVIDPELADERGFNVDLGLKYKHHNIQLDASIFYLGYRNRIGEVLREIPPSGQLARYRTNIGSSRNWGVESFVEWDFWKQEKGVWSVFQNASWIDARYTSNTADGLAGNRVELVPTFNLKWGSTFQSAAWRVSGQFGYVSRQFTDASNAAAVSNAIFGEIPAYSVLDFSAAYQWKAWKYTLSVDNALNSAYFTRRATGYPGPGIIPAAPRQIFLNIGFQF